MSRLTETILDAIYTPNLACAICGSEAHADSHCLCAECAALIQPAGIIGSSGFIDDIYCAVHYTEHIAAAVHNYKYNDARYLCRFADRIAKGLADRRRAAYAAAPEQIKKARL